MVCAIVSSVIYCVFEPQCGQTNDHKIGRCSFSLNKQLLSGRGQVTIDEKMMIPALY
jgi:hypothetical protein